MPRTKSTRYVKIHSWNGLQHTRPHFPLTPLNGTFYTLRVGLLTLKKLGYSIAYNRRTYKWPRCSYALIRLTSTIKDLCAEITPTYGRGIKTSLPKPLGRYTLTLELLLQQLPRNAVNLDPRRYEYQLVAVFLNTKEGKTVDVDTLKTSASDQRGSASFIHSWLASNLTKGRNLP